MVRLKAGDFCLEHEDADFCVTSHEEVVETFNSYQASPFTGVAFTTTLE
jgi:hypothetical protein